MIPGNFAYRKFDLDLAQTAFYLRQASRSLTTTLLAKLVGDNLGTLENDAASACHIGVSYTAHRLHIFICR